MSKDIRQLTKGGEQFYPQTHIAGLVGYGENGKAIDDEPTAGSKNLVKSGDVVKYQYEKQSILDGDYISVGGQLLEYVEKQNDVYYIGSNRIVETNQNYISTEYVKVQPGDTIHVHVRTGNNINIVTYFDSKYSYVSHVLSNATTFSGDIVIPSGVTFAIFTVKRVPSDLGYDCIFGNFKVNKNSLIKSNTLLINKLRNSILNDRFNPEVEIGAIDISGNEVANNSRLRTGFVYGKFELETYRGLCFHKILKYDLNGHFIESIDTSEDKYTSNTFNFLYRFVVRKTDSSAFSEIPAHVFVAGINNHTPDVKFINDYYNNQIITRSISPRHDLFINYGGLINGMGYISTSANLLTTDFIKVSEGDFITVCGYGGVNFATLAYYDENFFYIGQEIESGNDGVEKTFTAPVGAKYVRATKRPNVDGYIWTPSIIRNDYKVEKGLITDDFEAKAVQNIPALPDAMNIHSVNFDANNVNSYVYDLWDDLMSANSEIITKINCNETLDIDASSEYPLIQYKISPKRIRDNAEVKKIFIVSGNHPEYMAVWALYNTIKYIIKNRYTDSMRSFLYWNFDFYIIPIGVPYNTPGRDSFGTKNGVDVCRNFKTNDWIVYGTVGNKGYTGTTPLSEAETQIQAYYIRNSDIAIDMHNFYESSGKSMCWTVPPISPLHKNEIERACNRHIKAMTSLWHKQFNETFPADDVDVYGNNTKATEDNITSGTLYVGMFQSYAAQYGVLSLGLESCETCSFLNGTYYYKQAKEWGTSDCSTRAVENQLNMLYRLANIVIY